MAKTFHGYRQHKIPEFGTMPASETIVKIREKGRERDLPKYLHIRSHSPEGFEWGFVGNGPAQLALALVANVCGVRYAIPRIYRKVMGYMCCLAHDGWTITEEDVKTWVELARDEVRFNRQPELPFEQ
jgi:hypothetical protein